LEEEKMNMILGMDIWVFCAWIGTIFASIICLLYGIYYWLFVRKQQKELSKSNKIKITKKGRK
jgi:uncharacterized membrane protein YukC